MFPHNEIHIVQFWQEYVLPEDVPIPAFFPPRLRLFQSRVWGRWFCSYIGEPGNRWKMCRKKVMHSVLQMRHQGACGPVHMEIHMRTWAVRICHLGDTWSSSSVRAWKFCIFFHPLHALSFYFSKISQFVMNKDKDYNSLKHNVLSPRTSLFSCRTFLYKKRDLGLFFFFYRIKVD